MLDKLAFIDQCFFSLNFNIQSTSQIVRVRDREAKSNLLMTNQGRIKLIDKRVARLPDRSYYAPWFVQINTYCAGNVSN